eukprot:5558375-Pleurochrysis_carterae.AAC.1
MRRALLALHATQRRRALLTFAVWSKRGGVIRRLLRCALDARRRASMLFALRAWRSLKSGHRRLIETARRNFVSVVLRRRRRALLEWGRFARRRREASGALVTASLHWWRVRSGGGLVALRRQRARAAQSVANKRRQATAARTLDAARSARALMRWREAAASRGRQRR